MIKFRGPASSPHLLVLVALLAFSFALDDRYFHPNNFLSDEGNVHNRMKRDGTVDIFDAAGSLGVGEKYIKKFRTLVEGVPPKMQDALISQDFSNVTADDMRALNVSVMEYLPPKVIAKLNFTLLSPVIDKLLQYNRPMAMGRVMQVISDKVDTTKILDKIKENGGIQDHTEEAASVMLHSALSKVGDKGGLDSKLVNRLSQDGLLKLVPEEQLMKVTEPQAAKDLLSRLYKNKEDKAGDLTDLDDQALIYKLAETGYGKAQDWGTQTLNELSPQVVAQLPAQFLKDLKPEAAVANLAAFKNMKFENPLQTKSVADIILANVGIKKDSQTSSSDLRGIVIALGGLAAFVPPSVAKGQADVLTSIIESCNQANLPAPFSAVRDVVKERMKGKQVQDLNYGDLEEMGGAVIKNAPPSVVSEAVKKRFLNHDQLNQIAKDGEQNGGFFRGVVAQVASFAVKFFGGSGGRGFDIRRLPSAFLGALGIRGLATVDNRNINDELLEKLKENPDSLDEAQKALLLKRLRDAGLLDSADLPPEIRALQPRRKGDRDPNPKVLEGLPTDSELRLAYGYGKKYSAHDLEMNPILVGTLTPKQVMDMDLEEIPAVLALVRESKEGPGTQTLEALSKRFAEYIRSKAEDYEAPDKKLLRYLSAAEVSKLPATVLAYFIDPRQTAKLPPDVRKEIMIAMGELSPKDKASIPGKTREEIILQGLAAIDKLTSGESKKKLDVPELAAIGSGVSDLSPDRVKALTPVATEQALELIKGTADDDDDRLKVRACLTPEQRKAWRGKVIELYGEPKSWEGTQVSALCCLLPLLEESDLKALNPEALATCSCASDLPPPSHLTEVKKALDSACKHELGEQEEPKKIVQKVKSEIVFDLDDLESQIITGRRKRHTHDHHDDHLTCYKVRLTGSAAPFSKEQLESLKKEHVADCIYELGLDPLPLEHARVVWNKLVEGKGGKVEALTAEDFRFAGHILTGIKLSEVPALNMADWDIVFPFGKTGVVNKKVLEKMATNLEEKTRKPLSSFQAVDLAVTKNILCGFTPEKLSEIHVEAFREALPVLKNLDENCEQTRLSAIAALTMQPEVFGEPSTWTPADVRGAGILLIALPSRAIEAFPPEAWMGLTPSVAAALPPSILSLISPEQAENIPRFAALSLSEKQKDSMKPEARERLDSVSRGPLVTGGGGRVAVTGQALATLLLSFFVARSVLT